jgi:Peptidase A4 family
MPASPQTQGISNAVRAADHARTALATAADYPNSFAGYDQGGSALAPGSVTEVSALWQVPALDCAETPNAVVAIWVGIDFYENPGNWNPFLQLGPIRALSCSQVY